MLSRIQIRAKGETAHDVERELVWAAKLVIVGFGLEAALTDQVIEGTPGAEFGGRLTLNISSQENDAPAFARGIGSQA